MLRSALVKNARAAKQSVARRGQSSTSSGGNSGGGTALKVLLGTTTVAGASGLIYARTDPSFAKTLKDNLPFLEPVLVAVGADVSGGGSPSISAPSKPSATASDPPPLVRKPKPIEVPKEAPKKPTQVKSDDVVKSPVENPRESELQRQKQNFILEQSLRDVSSAAERASLEAASEMEHLADKSGEYAEKLMRALNEASATGGEDHFMWKEANEAKANQSQAQKKATTKSSEAEKTLQRLEEAIRKGRADSSTKDNMNLNQAEITLGKLKSRLETSGAAATKAMEKLNLAQHFGSSIEECKLHLIDEVNAMLPSGKSFSDPKNLSNDDLNVLVHHAHNKIQSLQKELARMQMTDDEKAKQYRQKLVSLDKEVSKQKGEVAKMVSARVQEERESFEVELQNQLRRQVGVHTDHLKEALEDQRQELTRKRQLDVEKAREDERSLQVARLTEAVELLQKMEAYLNARKVLDEASKKAKSLWLSCASLKHVLTQGRTEKIDSPQPLSADIVPLQEVSESSEFVKTVLSTIPDEALKRGVYPEIALKERFYKVETACRRVALMEDQNGGGPGRYLLSYLMSMFMVYPKPVPQEELDKEQKVNPLMWDTLDILSRVRASLLKDDLEQALRYANQLKGTPRQVAKDWIQEVRLLLETKQAANALMAFAAATVAEDLPKN